MVGPFDIEVSRQWCELAWSPDSIEWHRICPGTPLVPNGPVMGDYDWGGVFTSVPIIGKDKIRKRRSNEMCRYWDAAGGAVGQAFGSEMCQ